MTRILFTSMPMAGHVRPGLPVARALVEAGHDVLWYTGRKYGPLVERAGARFTPYPVELDWDDERIDELGGPQDSKPGLARLKWALLNVFIRPIPGHIEALREVFRDFQPDVVVTEQGFMAGAMLAEAVGLPRVVFTVSPLGVSSVDTAPFGTGKAPSSSPVGRLRNRSLNWAVRNLVFRESQREAESIRAALGLPPIDAYLMDWGVHVANHYLVASVPELEYPRSDLPETVEFIGAMLPRAVDSWEPPTWWADLHAARAAGRPVVLVTQGTLATDPDNLVRPTIAALAQDDVLLIATTGGPDPAEVAPPESRPANLRIERYIPFTELLPHVDLVVTNGGFGGVQTALAYGVPLVGAGLTEDKMEVNARVDWAGVGVSLRTDTPEQDQIRTAVRRVLGDPAYRERAQALRAVYERYGGENRAAEIVLDVARSFRSESMV